MPWQDGVVGVVVAPWKIDWSSQLLYSLPQHRGLNWTARLVGTCAKLWRTFKYHLSTLVFRFWGRPTRAHLFPNVKAMESWKVASITSIYNLSYSWRGGAGPLTQVLGFGVPGNVRLSWRQILETLKEATVACNHSMEKVEQLTPAHYWGFYFCKNLWIFVKSSYQALLWVQ